MIRYAILLCAFLLASVASANDRYVDYYYPQITSEETFDRVIRSAPSTPKAVRVDFVNVLTTAQLNAPPNPRFVFFSKGERATTLILTALDDEVFATLFRARAIMAQLTVSVRKGGFFQEQNLQDVATFYDLLQLMAFDELLITDGKTWTHRVRFER